MKLLSLSKRKRILIDFPSFISLNMKVIKLFHLSEVMSNLVGCSLVTVLSPSLSWEVSLLLVCVAGSG